jgi:hypothetical protein
MSQVLARLLISLAASQWLYAELLLFYPDVDQVARRVLQVLSIPTHDRWNATDDSAGMRTLAKLFGRRVPRQEAAPQFQLVRSTRGPSQPISVHRSALSELDEISMPLLQDETAYEDLFEESSFERPFVSGRAIFGSLSDRAGFRTPI